MTPITRRQALSRCGRVLIAAAMSSFFPMVGTGCASRDMDAEMIEQLRQRMTIANLGKIKLTVIYDNVPFKTGLRTDWGFACLVEGVGETILFDAGRYDDIFMSNLSMLHIDPLQIDEMILSHDHPDHIGASLRLLDLQPGMTVTLVRSFPAGFKSSVRKTGAEVRETHQPGLLSGSCLSTGEMHSFVKNEQGLVIATDGGTIVLTGCAHPDVVEIVDRARQITGQDVLLVAGGFHLMMDDEGSIRNKVRQLRKMGVRYAAPSYCTGSYAMEIFAKEFSDGFIHSGVGRIITAAELV